MTVGIACKLSVLVGLFSTVGLSGYPEGYEWADKDHACIVEHSQYSKVDGPGTGRWSNAPKSFFVKITNCRDYIASSGLNPGESPMEADLTINRKQANVNACARAPENTSSSLALYYVVDATHLKGFIRPEFVKVESVLSSSKEWMLFGRDGVIDQTEYGELASNEGAAWFNLRARCTVLER